MNDPECRACRDTGYASLLLPSSSQDEMGFGLNLMKVICPLDCAESVRVRKSMAVEKAVLENVELGYPMKWEHMYVRAIRFPRNIDQNWELVAVVPGATDYGFYFKRPVR